MNQSARHRHIKAHIAQGDKPADKAEQHYIAASQYLKTRNRRSGLISATRNAGTALRTATAAR